MKFGLLCAALLALSLGSCVPTALATRQHRLEVVDAESGAPVAGATVDLHYYPSAPQAPDPNRPRAVADARGQVTIASAAQPTIWQVQAPGYNGQQFTASGGNLPPRYASAAGGASPYDGVAHLYRLPPPRLTVQVSDAYTGPLTINLQPAPGFAYVQVDQINVAFAPVDPQASYIQGAAGERTFTETASARGVVTLTVTPLLFDITASGLQVRDQSKILPPRDIANPGDTGRGVWGQVSDDDKRLRRQISLYIGTLAEYRAYLRTKS